MACQLFMWSIANFLSSQQLCYLTFRSSVMHTCFAELGELFTWWHHQMETFSVLLAICVGNSLVTGKFPAQRPVMRSFNIFFDLRLNEQLSKQSWGWWFEMLLHPLWRHCNEIIVCYQQGVIWYLSLTPYVKHKAHIHSFSVIKMHMKLSQSFQNCQKCF